MKKAIFIVGLLLVCAAGAEIYKGLLPSYGVIDWSLWNGNTNLFVNYDIDQKTGNLQYAVVDLNPLKVIKNRYTFDPTNPPDYNLDNPPRDFFFTIDRVKVIHNHANESDAIDTVYVEIRDMNTRELLKRVYKTYSSDKSNPLFKPITYVVDYTTTPGQQVAIYVSAVLGDTALNEISIVADCVIDGDEDGFSTNTKSKYSTSSYKYNKDYEWFDGWRRNSGFTRDDGSYWGAQDWAISADITFGDYNAEVSVNPDEGSHNNVLHQNTFDGAQGHTVIRYEIGKPSRATLTIHDLNGKTVFKDTRQAQQGTHDVTINLDNFSGGVYYYQLQTADYTDRKKLAFLK